MLLISFLGEEPKYLFKLIYVDFLTVILQMMLLQSKYVAPRFARPAKHLNP